MSRKTQLYTGLLTGLLGCLGLPGRAWCEGQPLGSPPEVTKQAEESTRPFGVAGGLQWRQLAVADQDPANNQYLLFFLAGSYRLPWNLSAVAQLGATQKFVAEEGETGFFFQDMALGLGYKHTLPLPRLGQLDKVSLGHQLLFYLPTSRASWNQDLILAPQWKTVASVSALSILSLDLEGFFQYRFHRYADRVGPGGGLNTRLVLGGALRGNVDIWEWKSWGKLRGGVEGSCSWVLKYPSRDSYEASVSDQAPWFQGYGWATYLDYAPRSYVSFRLALEQGGNVLREGIVNTFLFHRDETELSFGATFTY